MKKISILFLQAVLVLIGLVALAILIRFPLIEGRAANLDWFRIYSDPFILYGYAVSSAFFVALYKGVQLLSYIRQNILFSLNAVRTVRSIKYCTILLCLSIALAGCYILLFHPEEEDPAGFLAMCIVVTFICSAGATGVAVLEKILQNAVDMKSENDLTI
ncbi:DUF2975 domain-containing protein [Adhaeribacter arboris]|uniref:DUF2975 domain-containing protein n=1 Tax=Adhaeribacter arboris TaxID=2072846 RepID=A0A2T2YMI3_9BACT|nr:DUF2975 domain-containing protein [Adhaeribacter arboris]PSR56717.1 DUF2975 domain-containing protein [Adhaeribacter arboris]